ncbi:DUF4153 domain-containing protein [Pedobacter endophyticus]|uniref:DUF4173 domain-containing protein n=1 Tax=Pedobacter endophyticus TaxID=2789740 RepID=A0A7S9KYY5_9SPHI|nr:DUF4173 domain-containing protein [Pedobacter endophyticus]QPH39406.1 DUF4173 domain-containing protein [Pedobacter endophyticus]
MKNKSNFLLASTLIGGVLFNAIFWEERLALNLFIYSLFIIAVMLLNKSISKSAKFGLYAGAHLFAAVLVVVNNSDLSLAAYYISLLAFIGFSHFQQIRTVFLAIVSAVFQLITAPVGLLQNMGNAQLGTFNLKPMLRFFRYIILPIFIIIVFTSIYCAANEVFAEAVNSILNKIGNFFYDIVHFFFKDININRVLFFCFGLLVTAGLLIKFISNFIERLELLFKEQLLRLKKTEHTNGIWVEFMRIFTGNLPKRKLGLKTEYIIALISFASLNLLLLSLNLVDITTLWFSYEPSGSLSANVHHGANALIASIILAMVVIIFFFRGNLNFYSKSKPLRVLAYTWMAQNFILIISVFIRDGYYIEFYGLTHKRIGVVVFAILCTIGLATVYIKVARQKTLFYLLKVNGNVWFVLLLAFATINWDVVIVRYNLAHTASISLDPDYLLSLSEKTLPILDQNRAILLAGPSVAPREEVAVQSTNKQMLYQIDTRIRFFKERCAQQSWLSWNLQDWHAAKYFEVDGNEAK